MLHSALAFAVFAAVVTVTPGLDTMLVLRTAAVDGRRPAFAAGAGIALGCLCWAAASALGITALLTASRLGYDMLRWAGAAYLCWLGLRLLRRTRRPMVSTVEPVTTAGSTAGPDTAGPGTVSRGAAGRRAVWRGTVGAFRVGLTTNLLNPKVGVFYLSVLPQFLPSGVPPLLASTALGAVHVAEGLLWFALLIALVGRAARVLTRPAVSRRLDQLTGAIFIGLGVRLAASR